MRIQAGTGFRSGGRRRRERGGLPRREGGDISDRLTVTIQEYERMSADQAASREVDQPVQVVARIQHHALDIREHPGPEGNGIGVLDRFAHSGRL